MHNSDNTFAHLWAVQKHMLKHMMIKIGVCAYWILLAIVTGLLVGAYSTLFAWVLGKAVGYRNQYSWLLFLLPLDSSTVGCCFFCRLAVCLSFFCIGRRRLPWTEERIW